MPRKPRLERRKTSRKIKFSLTNLQEDTAWQDTLPSGWVNLSTHSAQGTVCFRKMSDLGGGNMRVVQCVAVHSNHSCDVFVEGKKVPPICQALACLKPLMSRLTREDLPTILSELDATVKCSGNPDKKFDDLRRARKGVFLDVSGTKQVAFYDEEQATIRSTSCELLVDEDSSRCEECSAHRQTLHRLALRLQKDPDRTRPESHTNFRYLSTPEKDIRLQRLHNLARVEKQRVTRLRARLEEALQDRAVQLDEPLHSDLAAVVKEESTAIKEAYPENSFSRIFWDNQERALSVKDGRQMRWDPLMVKWCLYLKHLSSSAYEVLRQSGVIKLPSQRTLRDYTHHLSATSGFSSATDRHLMQVARVGDAPEREKYVLLVMDEMHIKEDIVYDKHTGAILGVANISDVSAHLSAFERVINGEEERPPPLAKSMLVLLVRGLFSTLQYPYAQFPCTALSGHQMYEPFWEAVGRLELCGLKVVGLTCDGLAANRSLFKLHDSCSKSPVHKVPNPYATDGRQLFFFVDPPHLLKTVRNAWANPKRKLWVNGKSISWNHLRDLYAVNRSSTTPGLALVPKLKFEHINLTSFSKMRVDLAAQVLSESVAKALELTQPAEKVKETVKFASMFNKFFDCMNVSSLSAGKRERDPFKAPYRSSKDFRLKWLEDEFLSYLDLWEESVKQREGFSKAQRSMMFLSQEIALGLRITVKSFVELLRSLFGVPDVSLFLSSRLNQDPLEKFFGQQRQRGGTSDNPNVEMFFKNTQALRVISTTCSNVRGNCRGSQEIKDTENAPLPKRRRKH